MAFDYSQAHGANPAKRRRRADEADAFSAPEAAGLETTSVAMPNQRQLRRGTVLKVAAGEVLFKAGEPKDERVFRIRRGSLAVEPVGGAGGHPEAPVMIYEAGAFAGLGFRCLHAATGRAVTDLEVVVWSLQDFERLAARSPLHSRMRDQMVRLEFLWRRRQCVEAGRAQLMATRA